VKYPRRFDHGRSGVLVVAILALAVVRPRAADEIERNWALQGAVTQSSTAFGGDPRRAIDGNTNGGWNDGSVTHTSQELEPYWQIDLGQTHYIDEIRIFNRTDCCQDRLKNFVVFFANNKEGFLHRDLNSTMGQNTGNPNTAVYMKPVFNLAGDIDPVGGAKLARHTIKFNGSDCAEEGKPGCKIRFVRIQLAGQGILSLAEVQIIERASIPGPAAVDDAVSWVPTGVITTGAGATFAATDDKLLVFYRGSDGLLHGSENLADGPVIGGSPGLGPDQPAATVLGSQGRGFVAVRTASSQVAVAEGDARTGALGSAAWSTLGQTSGSPAVITGCNRAVVAWLDDGRLMAAWKSTDPASGAPGWSAPAVVSVGSGTPPSLAVDSRQNVGMSFVLKDGSIAFTTLPCAATEARWETTRSLVGLAKGDQASLAAYGPHFIVATLGGDNRGYLAVQRTASDGREEWQGFEPIPASWRGDPGMLLLEAPRIFVMSGAIVVVARDRMTQEMRYWLKYPNHLSPGDTWMGGRVVGGSGRGAMAPAMVSFGKSRLWGMGEAPSELYVGTLGIGDRRVYAMNLGRFIANDVLTADLSLDVEGMLNIDPQPDRGLDPTLAPNYFEQLLALLALPGPAREAVRGRKCGNLMLATRLMLDRNYGSGQFRPAPCPYEVVQNTDFSAADAIIHEWLHLDAAARNLPGMSDFGSTFRYADGSDPAGSGMKACRASADCGGDFCEKAGDDYGKTRSSTKDFDPSETSLRRWDETFVCVSNSGPDARRPQGGLRWYDVGTRDHAFIHMAIAYRWYGDDLRDWVQADLSHGNDQLQRRYAWVKANYFGDVEYNGRLGRTALDNDRSLGAYGMPDR
jgi:hypothetical protein